MAADENETKIGRPRMSLNDLPENWSQIIIEAAREGASDVECRSLLGISNTGWYSLIENEPLFSETVKQAKQLCQVWWERAGRTLAVSGGGNAAVYIFNMKNRFGWRDKNETASDDEDVAPVKVEVTVTNARKRNADAE